MWNTLRAIFRELDNVGATVPYRDVSRCGTSATEA